MIGIVQDVQQQLVLYQRLLETVQKMDAETAEHKERKKDLEFQNFELRERIMQGVDQSQKQSQSSQIKQAEVIEGVQMF